MMKKSQTPDRAEVINPARQLSAVATRDARWKLAGAAWWGFVLVVVSAAMSFVTGGVLTRLMPELLAYTLGGAIHLAIGLATHLLIIGVAQRDHHDLWAGRIFLGLGLLTLFWVSCGRAFILQEEGHTPLSAWLISLFLFSLEVAIPALLGFLLAKAWLARNDAAEEAAFYRRHSEMIEQSSRPADRWNDSEDRLADEILSLEAALKKATPEEQTRIQGDIARLKKRLYTLREWNPTRAWGSKPPSTPEPDEEAAEPVFSSGRDGQEIADILFDPVTGMPTDGNKLTRP